MIVRLRAVCLRVSFLQANQYNGQNGYCNCDLLHALFLCFLYNRSVTRGLPARVF